MQSDLVVYTLAIGGDYGLPDVRPQSGVDYICFTDQEISETKGWTIRTITPLLPGDTFRSSRDYKIRPHRHLASYDRSIYIDSSVRILVDPEAIWNRLMPDASLIFGGLYHSYRDTVSDEFQAVAKYSLDYPETLDEQQTVYQDYSPSALSKKPVWGGFLARRHNASSCATAMEVWFANVLRYSRRDQLSLPLALMSIPDDEKQILDLDISNSELHEWPVHEKPRPAGYRLGQDESWFQRKLRNYLRKRTSQPRRR